MPRPKPGGPERMGIFLERIFAKEDVQLVGKTWFCTISKLNEDGAIETCAYSTVHGVSISFQSS